MSSLNLRRVIGLMVMVGAASLPLTTQAAVYVQCPGDTNGDARPDVVDPNHPNAVCMHLTGGDGFIKMADDKQKLQYMFGFHNVTGVAPANVMADGLLAAEFPAPTIALKEGDEFYLSLTNVGMTMRPDLFDAHSVHFHGFPQAAAVFDGVPEASFGIGMGSSITYYYNLVEPGTYLYHCHVEAAEHMQMGMLGNLYVRPRQDGTLFTYNGRSYNKFVYNDGDGSTGYDVDFPLQLSSMDHNFHDASLAIQPLPFADLHDTYSMINGRGYPDTVVAGNLVAPVTPVSDPKPGKVSQKVSSLVRAVKGQRVLLRMSNVSVTNFYTVTALGLPMKVVGRGAHILRGPTGKNLYYDTASLTLGGGETADVMIDTTDIPVGTYYLYTTNLNYLTNFDEDTGGMMTEIRITAPVI